MRRLCFTELVKQCGQLSRTMSIVVLTAHVLDGHKRHGMPWECHGNAMGITIDSDRLRDVSKCFILSRVTLHELSILYNLYVLFCFVLPH